MIITGRQYMISPKVGSEILNKTIISNLKSENILQKSRIKNTE
jgi:hypothetical protein